ncbi:hypothetical protein [Vibrio brasiliensis]|uniref:hypothetical protein n=1 Tax=Vibrio brasiliensis TaxID=170652 RepID=UPI001EFE3F1A|nr:hypothetical protein [Vibrio brasiliensis]MCG9727089.1 hypothetical protein [Vibrio brasiliensis]
MNNPKVFLTAMLLLCLIFAATVLFLPAASSSTVTGTVVSQTLTQSLDGHRRYLSVSLSDGDTALVTAPATSNCPQGSSISLIKEKGIFGSQSHYRFDSCRANSN